MKSLVMFLLELDVSKNPNKRKTPKEVRQAGPKPKARTSARAQQNWRERYLTTKKRVDTLQPDHNLPQDFVYAVRNNMHNPNVRGAAKTAGKLMVYGKGETMKQFVNGTLKLKKDCYIMAHAADMAQLVTEIEDNSEEEEKEEEDEDVEPLTEKERKRRRREDREDSPDIYNMGATARQVNTPGS